MVGVVDVDDFRAQDSQKPSGCGACPDDGTVHDPDTLQGKPGFFDLFFPVGYFDSGSLFKGLKYLIVMFPKSGAGIRTFHGVWDMWTGSPG